MPPEEIDSLNADSLKGLVLSLLAKIGDLVEQNKALLARIAELEGRAGKPPKTPTNSSLPPSSGQKANVADAAATKRSRKGHPGVARELCVNPDVTRDIYVERCACGAKLSAADQVLARAYDHVELPPIKPVTMRINLHRADCRCCGNIIIAEPPADMPPGPPFGPGIVALVIYLHGCQMVGYARLAEMLEGLFGLKISEGAIANMLARAAEPFAECAQTIHETVRNSPVIASDETSARVKGKTHWLWRRQQAFAARRRLLFHGLCPSALRETFPIASVFHIRGVEQQQSQVPDEDEDLEDQGNIARFTGRVSFT